MMKSILLAAGAICLAASAYAQTVRAVVFGSNTYLSNNGAAILPPPGNFSSRASWSCWYNIPAIGLNQQRVIYSSYVAAPAPGLVAEISILNTYQVQGIANGNHVVMKATDGVNGGNNMLMVSDDTVLADGQWHHLHGGWDTSGFNPNPPNYYKAAVTYDSHFLAWNATHSGPSGQPPPFVTPYQTVTTHINNNWTHGAYQDPIDFTVSEYFQGDASECVFNNNIPSGAPQRYALYLPDLQISYPLAQGPMCAFAVTTIPPLCFRGDHVSYRTNLSGARAFTVNGTALTDALDDPWVRLP